MACFPELRTKEWLNIPEAFHSQVQYPSCIGAIYGKHVGIIQPTGGGSTYFCYKRYISRVLMAVCDANCKFISTDAGSYGKVSDSSIYKNIVLSKKYRKILWASRTPDKYQYMENRFPSSSYVTKPSVFLLTC